jgi:carboxyl-terminal processing protease
MKRMVRPLFYIALFLAIISMSFYGGKHESDILRHLGVENIEAKSISGEGDDFGLLMEAVQIVRDHYLIKLNDKEDSRKMLYGSIRGMLKSLDDPYTRFMDPDAYTNMTVETRGKFGGIGIQIGIRNDFLTVIAPLKDTPAEKAGIKSFDIITKINGAPTEDMALDDAVARIRGTEGTKVTLTIWRRGFESEGKDFELTRAVIEVKPVNKTEMLEDKIGYVKLETFSEMSEPTVREAIEKFNKQGMKAFILDLRYNPGGLLTAAVQLANMFIDEGPIVHRVSRDGEPITYYAKRGRKIINVPVVVLVNGGSASASEILAGALQDLKAATIIGETTFGKGLVQTVYTLDDGSAMLVTTDKYLTAMKRDIHKKGIVPDIVVSEEAVDAHEGNQKDDSRDNATAGEFKLKDYEGKNTVALNGSPIKDLHYKVYDGKTYLEVDEAASLFGVNASLDDKTGILYLDKEIKDDNNLENDIQLKKAIEFLKQKIGAK